MDQKIEEIKKLCLVAIKEGKDNAEDEMFNACDASGGNFDDAYYIGQDVGAYHLAKGILELLGEQISEAKEAA
jgi:hypothetical protein